MRRANKDVHLALREVAPEDKALELAVLLNRRDEGLDRLKRDVAILKWMATLCLVLTAALFVHLCLG